MDSPNFFALEANFQGVGYADGGAVGDGGLPFGRTLHHPDGLCAHGGRATLDGLHLLYAAVPAHDKADFNRAGGAIGRLFQVLLHPGFEGFQAIGPFLSLEGGLALQAVVEGKVVVRSIGLADQAPVFHLQGAAAVDGEPAQNGEGISFDDVQLAKVDARLGRVFEAVHQQRAGAVFQVKTAAGGAPDFGYDALYQVAGGVRGLQLEEFFHAQLAGLRQAKGGHKGQKEEKKFFHTTDNLRSTASLCPSGGCGCVQRHCAWRWDRGNNPQEFPGRCTAG